MLVPDGHDGRFRFVGTVLESPEHGPQLCGAVALSLPPQCSGPDVVGWSWLAVIDTRSHRVSATVTLGPPGTDPFNIAVTPTTIYVTNQGAGTLTVIDPTTLEIAATVEVGTSPYGVATSQ